MRPILTLVAISCVTFLSAQITIGPADMPSAGDTVRYWNTSAIGIDPAPTEAGYIWDMSMLTPDVEAADTCISVNSTPFLYQFFFNNMILYPNWAANYAVRGQEFNFQMLTLTDVFDYFKKDATGFRNVGFGANVNGIPTSVRRTPVDYVHRFPMNYDDMDTSYSEFTVAVPTLFSFTQQQTRFNHVDGWGTLYLPADTFEVLRVRSVLQRSDSVFIEQFGQGFAFDEPETIEYKWIAVGMDEPVLQINTTGGQATTARFFYDPNDIILSVPVIPEITFSAQPNPAQQSVSFSVPASTSGVLEFRDATGRLVGSMRVPSGSTTVRHDVSGFADGTYVATLISSSGSRSTRMIVQH
ncbi:MAG: T9SS type A sorting domain-containing protein [Flavobacteriales bacterium]|nr:T9SS type A sorting domain-containing protein [Flavobacteriales bacterium]